MIAPVTRALFAICALAAAGIATLWYSGDKTWTPPPPRPIDAGLLEAPKVYADPPGGELFAEISARPLFDPSRRPPPPEPVAAAESEPDPFVNVKLLGLFGSAGEGGVILQIDGRSKRLRVGETLGPWTLRGTSGSSAHFIGARGEQKKLEMRYLAQPAPGPAQDAAAATAGGNAEAAAAEAAAPGQAKAPAAQAAESADPAAALANRAAERRAAVRARRQQIMNNNQ